MNLRPEQLERHLQGTLAPLYVVHGDEPLLALEAADSIRAAAKAAGFDEREIFTAEAGFNWAGLLFSGNALSLFGSRRLLDVRIPTGKPGVEGARAIQQYCGALPEDTVTLVTLPKIDWQTQKSQWFKALEQAGVMVAVQPVERRRLPQWIQQRLVLQRQEADAAALEFLADRVEGNLLAARQEIQKLGLLLPPGKLSFEQVQDAVLDVARYDVFQLGDAILAGNVARFARMLDGVHGEGVAATLVLWVLTQDIRILARMKAGQRTGTPLAQILRAARVRDARHGLLEGTLRRLPESTLRDGLRQAASIDRLIKGLRAGDVWDEMLQLGLLVARGR